MTPQDAATIADAIKSAGSDISLAIFVAACIRALFNK